MAMKLRTGRRAEKSAGDDPLSPVDVDGNTPLHEACASNNAEHAIDVCEKILELKGGEQLLKKCLLTKNEAGKTPINLTIDAAGDSDTGDASLKLLISGYIEQLNMLPEMFAPDTSNKDKGIWTRSGFDLPQLGALLVANESGKLCDTADPQNTLLDERAENMDFLNEYAELPHEAIGLIIASAFLEEFEEVEMWKKLKPWKESGGTYGKHSRLGGVLSKCCEFAQDAMEMADICYKEYRMVEGDKFQELSKRVQVATATVLDHLGNDVAFAVGCSIEGDQALNLACQSRLLELLSEPSVFGVILRKWRGRTLQKLLDRNEEAQGEWLYNAFVLFVSIVANVALLPLAALTPGLAKHRDFGYGKFFRKGGYLLQTAFFQAGVFAGSDMCLTITLTVSPQYPAYSPAIFVWTVAALIYELHQIFGRKTARAKTSWDAIISSYIKQDPFNVLDLTALVTATFAMGAATLRDMQAYEGEGVAAGIGDAADDLTGLGQSELTIGFETLGAAAVLLMWFRQLRLLMIVSTDMAPLVRMMRGMISDVLKFLQLLLIVLFGFAGALSTLFAGDETHGDESECGQLIGHSSSYWTILKILFEGSLLADSVSLFIECVKDSSHPVGGLILTYLFLILAVVLLLNMIIAMMGKTFERYYDAAAQEAAADFAAIVQDWEGQTELPAPFNLLSVPWTLLSCCGLLTSCTKDGAAKKAGYYTYPMSMHGSEGTRGDGGAKEAAPRNKGLRIYKLGDQPGGKADLEEIKDKIADKLQAKFGDYEDTGTLIDNAVRKLTDKMEDLQEHMVRAIGNAPPLGK